jgi:chemotaxis protein MotB
MTNNWSESEHEANRDRWLLSYADLLTLLLAFFVVMYSVSVVNENKLAELSSSLADSFNQPVQARPAELIDALQMDVAIEAQANGGMTIMLPGELLFDTGATELKATAKTALDRLLPLLKSASGRIAVEGHTDNVPMNNASLPSNWELSASRAGAAVRYLEQSGIARTQLSAAGFADTQPIASNDTVEGQASNRRVVFKVAGVNWQQVEKLEPSAGQVTDTMPESMPQSMPQSMPESLPGLESEPPLSLPLPPTSLQLQVQLDRQLDDDLLDIDQIDPALLEQVLRQIEGGKP